MTTPGKKIKITRKERQSGQIDKSKIPAQKHIVIKLNKPTGKSSGELQFQRGAETKNYVKKDVRTGDPSYGKESKTKDTPEFVKKAQRAGADFAEHKGKSYAAGETTTTKTPDKHIVKIKIHPEMKMVKKVAVEPKETGAGKERINQKFGNAGRRRLERVEWLKGRNKKTEAGFGG